MHRYNAPRSVITPRGFTLLELMLVVTVGAILVMVGTPAYQGYAMRGKIARAIADMTRIDAAIERFRINNDFPPTSLSEVINPVPKDPWGRDFHYLALIPKTKGSQGACRKDHKLNPLNTDYDLFSAGADGQYKTQITHKLSQDDIVRANDGAFVGIGADY